MDSSCRRTNGLTIDNYGYDTGIIEGTTGNHCVKCTAVNYCCFKDEQGKKPDKFNTTGIKLLDLILNGLTPGLYHPKCHCVEMPIETPSVEDIKLIIPEGKIWWLFENKMHMLEVFGYSENEKTEILETLKKLIKNSFIEADYSIRSINNYGVRITIYINFPGKRGKENKTYKLESGWTIFPNYKLKCNTFIGGLIE